MGFQGSHAKDFLALPLNVKLQSTTLLVSPLKSVCLLCGLMSAKVA